MGVGFLFGPSFVIIIVLSVLSGFAIISLRIIEMVALL